MKITAGLKKFLSTIFDSTLDPDSQVLVGNKYLILAALIRNLQLAFELVSDTLTVIWIWTLLQLATTNLLKIQILGLSLRISFHSTGSQGLVVHSCLTVGHYQLVK